jgi:hypothetical protein
MCRASQPLQLLHADICGPISPISNSHQWYLLTFIDDFSRKLWVFFLTDKSAANGVPLFVPLNPQAPAEDQETTRPHTSVTVTIVLLKLVWTWITPLGTCLQTVSTLQNKDWERNWHHYQGLAYW